ncbi:hypothetical protein Mal15_21290 [Stieleria maiorica]|uniref:Uncharacterized protein n=1 Tax=Stieleria maiorica TaxID=2795974 RepID=A0A5B9MA37_9BACT|nr:hypothetical protein [Stieleria maiorica]QEF98082.1 hypothetical protein Mal15_21290 [Stieleria maiorica]
MATAREHAMNRTGLDPITRRTLAAFRRRRGMLLVARAIGVALLTFISLTLLLATFDYLFFFRDTIRWLLSIGIYAATAAVMWLSGLSSLAKRDELEIARHVESVAPHLRENLVAAVELADPAGSNGSPYFRRLLQSRVARRIAKVDVGEVLPLRLVRRWVLSGTTVALLCIALMFIPSAQFGRRFARAALPGIAIERASRTKVTILEPSPPSRYVAERDAVGVIVRVLGAEADDVMLHWRSADGTSGESIMTPRMDASAFRPGADSQVTGGSDDAAGATVQDAPGTRFAANLSVGSVPIQYRITAGDAITLWHELTPLPRPHVVRYEKHYRLPTYAKLDDRSADEEHGDLKALQGTTAEVIVTFDQSVENPVVRFGVRGARSDMEPVDESGTKFLTRISIKTSGQYQVDATSVRSGLDNPFSPTNMIMPVLDTPPIVRWSDDTQPSRLVSSLDVIELSASAADDLPLERVLQEVQVNGGRFESYPLPIDVPDRKLDLNWSWDMLHRLGESSQTPQLAAGDLVKTRLVAIDRRGARTESPVIEFLIAGDGFDADRHQFLAPFADQIERIMKWSLESEKLANELNAIGDSGDFQPISDVVTRWKPLQQESVALIKSLTETLSATQNTASASNTELVGRAILDIETRLDGQIKQLQWLGEHQENLWSKVHKKHLASIGRDAKQTAYQSDRLRGFAQARFGLALSASLYSDASMLRDGVIRLVDDLPRQRLPRYLTLVAGQLAEIDRLIQQYEPLLSPQHAQHLAGDHWSRWSQRWGIQIETLLEDQASRDQVYAVLQSLRKEVNDKPQSLVYSETHDAALRWGRDLRKEMRYLADLTRELADAGRAWKSAESAAERDRNAEDAIKSGLDVQWNRLRWQTQLNRLIVRAAGQERLNRAKSKVDLQYAADQSLFVRAIKNVTENGYQDYDQEPADRVLNAIAGAIGVLQATSDIAAAREDWLSIREGEGQSDSSPLRKIYHPVWLKLQDVRVELGVRYLRQSNVDSKAALGRIDATRHNDDHNQANARIDPRRWSMDKFLSAEKSLQSLARDLQIGLDDLEADRDQARDVLGRYVLTLAQQARQAAEEADQAKRATDARADASEESAEDVRPEQDEAIEKSTETIGALIDQANTTDIVNDEQREVARDADAAAELIAEAVQETKEALKQAESATSEQQRDDALESVEEKLTELSQRLQQTAEHFEKIEQGQDVSQSRQQLRQAEAELDAADALSERYENAEQMAEAAKQDPRELLRQLEEELQRNEPMQEALSDIAAETVDEVADNLRQAAKEEDALQRRLESEDSAFAEQKRQTQLMLDEFVQRAKTLRDRTLATASKAAGWANEPETQKSIEMIREQLNDSINRVEQTSRGQPTLSELQSATRQMQNEVNQAARATEQSAAQLAQAADKDLHGDKQRRNTSAESMRRNENQLRNNELRALDQQRQIWSSTEEDAGRRVRNEEQKKRAAENVIRREQDQLKKNPDNDWHRREIEKQQDLLEQADRAIRQTRNTRELATERGKQAVKRANAINQSKAAPLDKPNPAAELGQKVAQDASDRLKNLADELAQLAQDSDIETDLRATSDSARNIADQQQRVESDVQTAADDLARASRHEARLENDPAAQQLAQAAKQIEQVAGQAAKQAGEDLGRSVDESQRSADAAQSLQQAAEKIADQAEAIQSMTGQSQSPDGQADSSQGDPGQQSSPSESAPASASTASADATQSPSQSSGQSSGQSAGQTASGNQSGERGQPSASQPTPQQMAQTLDDLDRSLADGASPPGQPSDSQQASASQQSSAQQPPAQSSQGNQGQPSDSQSAVGKPGGEPSGQGRLGSGQPPQSAVEASPTLAQMLEAQMQQAARERLRSLQQAQAGEQPGQPPSSDPSSPNPVSESGQGEMPDGPDDVDLIQGAIADGDWGDLRRRGVDDAAQGRSIQIPPGYSREIKAYFKALSKRAAESK